MTTIITDNLRIIAGKIVDNRKIEAIKDLRMITNMGLKESKDIVDRAAYAGGTPANSKAIQTQMYHDLVREGFLFDDQAPATMDPSRGYQTAYTGAAPPPYNVQTQSDSLSEVVKTHMGNLTVVLTQVLAEMREQTALLKDMMEVMSE